MNEKLSNPEDSNKKSQHGWDFLLMYLFPNRNGSAK
ncbi:hypothetical protein SAMN05421877_102144 [Sphingobacterium lactis]|uniref:Uncharacterized protein n=1 Tax=Sphingobacterium lactis TaxID=797291 RepID=A0A1H5U2Q4_9SPHI|nr:hypothetical protein SAMN05421877_102144 [Sphingobacterium lactis]